MKRKLLLDSRGFPKKFNLINVKPPKGMNKQTFVENSVKNAINEFNPKLNLSSVDYVDIRTQFKHFKSGKYVGLIVEDNEISKQEQHHFESNGYYVFNNSTSWFSRRIVTYVFFSDYVEKGRNIMCQTIFPELIGYMEEFISSPSFSISNCPIYYVNIFSDEITAPSINNEIFAIKASNIEYIEVFTNNKHLVGDIESIEDYLSKIDPAYIKGSPSYTCSYYSIDFLSKAIKLKRGRLVVGDKIKQNDKNKFDFSGSSEKIYWLEILPIVVLGGRDKYNINCSGLSKIIEECQTLFTHDSLKLNRFIALNEFIEKQQEGN